ncbi:hypothetical protein GCM10007417_28460 [Glycocaulis alkaliphilus]|nr:hypothetical protein GCM10007417_28460 [Glycocaulis alkaliphilus]
MDPIVRLGTYRRPLASLRLSHEGGMHGKCHIMLDKLGPRSGAGTPVERFEIQKWLRRIEQESLHAGFPRPACPRDNGERELHGIAQGLDAGPRLCGRGPGELSSRDVRARRTAMTGGAGAVQKPGRVPLRSAPSTRTALP